MLIIGFLFSFLFFSQVKDPDIDGHTKDITGHGPFDEKKVISEKRYIIPSRESIRMMAEAEGVTNLTDDGALILSEDLSYRLREIVQVKMKYVTFSMHIIFISMENVAFLFQYSMALVSII